MKTILFAAALSVSGIALAQTTTDPMATPGTNTMPQTNPTPGTNTMPDTHDMDNMNMAPGQTMDTGNDPDGMDPTPAPMTPPGDGITQQGTDPEGDAMAPAGVNNMPAVPGVGPVVTMPNQAAAFTPRPAATEYPACSKAVKDNCAQTYERGRR